MRSLWPDGVTEARRPSNVEDSAQRQSLYQFYHMTTTLQGWYDNGVRPPVAQETDPRMEPATRCSRLDPQHHRLITQFREMQHVSEKGAGSNARNAYETVEQEEVRLLP